MKSNFLYICVILLLTFCSDHEEVFDRPFPSIRTQAVTNITTNGAQFHGEILDRNGNEIIDHGFMWGTDPGLRLDLSEKKPMGEPEGNQFNFNITTTLEEGVTYYVRSYVTTSKNIVYGNAVSFVSLGSKAPVITDFQPKEGRILDTVSIKGSGFSFIKSNNLVRFAEDTATLISHTDTLLRVTVPQKLDLPKSKISVSVIGNIAVSEDEFTLIGGEITSISRSTLKPCDTLTIFGNNFSTNPSAIEVLLNSTVCRIIDLKSNQIKVVAPVFIPVTETVTLTVVSSNIEIVYGQPLTYKKPYFVGLKTRSNTTFNDTLTITAKNLPLCETMTLKIGNTIPSMVTYNDSTISFKIPESLTQTQNTISINFVNTPLSYTKTFTLSAPVITLVTPSNGTFNDVVTITGKNFHPQEARNLISLAAWGVSAITAEPTKLTVKVSVNASGGCAICDDLYVQVDQQTTEIKNAFTLNPPVITSISPSTLNAPGQVTINGGNFNPQADLNEVFVGNPATIISVTRQKIIAAVDLNTFSNGDPYLSSTTNTFAEVRTGNQVTNQKSITFNFQGPWTKKSPFPGNSKNSAITFSIGDFGYIGLGHNNNGSAWSMSSDFWKYNPSTDSWTRIADFPGEERWYATAFSIGTKGYVGLGQAYDSNGNFIKDLNDFWEYDTVTNTWTRIADFISGSYPSSYSFVINNLGYVGTYNSVLMSYNPTTNIWTEKASPPFNTFNKGTFVEAQKGYILVPNFPNPKVFEYDPALDNWVLKTTHNVALPKCFPLHNKGYFFQTSTYNFYTYTPSQNSWSSPLQSRPNFINLEFGFQINNKAYFLSGISEREIWELDMSKYPF